MSHRGAATETRPRGCHQLDCHRNIPGGQREEFPGWPLLGLSVRDALALPGSDLFSSSLLVAFISLLPVLFNFFFFLRFSASLRCHGAVTAPDTHFWGRKSPKRQPSVASVPFHRAICHPAALWGGTKIFLQRWKKEGGKQAGNAAEARGVIKQMQNLTSSIT